MTFGDEDRRAPAEPFVPMINVVFPAPANEAPSASVRLVLPSPPLVLVIEKMF